MWLCYIDESGTGLRDQRTPYFVYAAVAIQVDDVHQIDAQLYDLKRSWFSYVKPEDFEIKGRDMRRGVGAKNIFSGFNWAERLAAIEQITQLILSLPCAIEAVPVDKRQLPTFVEQEDDLHRITFWRLLDQLAGSLQQLKAGGMLMLDARSDVHSSSKDRRMVDAYREWVTAHDGNTPFVELPWFGFSAFYAGLQIADFVAYFVDFAANEGRMQQADTEGGKRRNLQLLQIIERLMYRVNLVQIP